ncbi:hypothetical protein [Anaerosolibacter sp.]|uniref:hypothetical protein n=1 Tax=Anaerosolibacter sp. TaxID=1872527 RepID=UPI0039EFDC24
MKRVNSSISKLIRALLIEVKTPEEVLYISEHEVQEKSGDIKELLGKIEKYKEKVEIEIQYLENKVYEKSNHKSRQKIDNRETIDSLLQINHKGVVLLDEYRQNKAKGIVKVKHRDIG